MRSLILVLGLVACGPPLIEDDIYLPDAEPLCGAPITIVAPRPELHYATDLAVIARTPTDNLTAFAIDDTGAFVEPIGVPTEQTGNDGFTLTWQFALQPSHRYTVDINNDTACSASVEFFTSP